MSREKVTFLMETGGGARVRATLEGKQLSRVVMCEVMCEGGGAASRRKTTTHVRPYNSHV